MRYFALIFILLSCATTDKNVVEKKESKPKYPFGYAGYKLTGPYGYDCHNTEFIEYIKKEPVTKIYKTIDECKESEEYKLLVDANYKEREKKKTLEKQKKIDSIIAKMNIKSKTLLQKYKKLGKTAMNGKIKIGMPTEFLYVAWGKPDKQNKSVGSYGVHIQHIYGKQYVYTKNGFITSWQSFDY